MKATNDVLTVQQLRGDVALQISRCLARRKVSMATAAKRLRVSQPTLRKIVNGRVSDLSLDLLIRIAVRAGLDLVLQLGAEPQEAGAFLSAARKHPRPPIRSKLADDAREERLAIQREMRPEQRLHVHIEHNKLLASLHHAGTRLR